MNQSATLIGRIEQIAGTTLRATLTVPTDVGVIVVNGKGYRLGQIGSFLCVPLGIGSLYGVVTGIGATQTAHNEPVPSTQGPQRSWIDVELVGETDLSGAFKRGVSQYPTIGDELHLVSSSDLETIYGGQEEREFIAIGNVVGAESVWCPIDANKLVMRHSLVVGSTGSGKSTMVSSIIRKLANRERFPASRVLLIDMHGEYANAMGNLANVLTIAAENEQLSENRRALYVPFWALNFTELARIAFGALDELATSALRDLVVSYKSGTYTGKQAAARSPETLADAPIPFNIHAMWLELYNIIKATHTVQQTGQSKQTIAYAKDSDGNDLLGEAQSVTPPTYLPQQQGRIFLPSVQFNGRRAVDLLTSRLRDHRLSFMFKPGPFSVRPDGRTDAGLDTLLADWLGGDHPVTVLDLSGTPTDLATDVVGAVLRIVFEALFWARNFPEGGRERPLLVVLEEAHSYLKDPSSSAASAVNRIVREGRKYGIGCMIISQRPSDIDIGVLSQCGTCFAMRMSNSADRHHVANGVNESFEALMALLPSLRTGEVIITGESVAMPVRVEVPLPPRTQRPNSEDPAVYSEGPQHGWNAARGKEDYLEMLNAWAAQDPLALRQITKVKVHPS